VVDAMAARPDVDPDRIALIGISQGGYWVLKYRLGAEGAKPHGEPMGLATGDIRVFDWLDRHLAA
jgi:hypothetical protein